MKKNGNLPPSLKYNARLVAQAGKPAELEWVKSQEHELEHDHADGEEQPGHGSGFFHKIREWIDRRIGAHHDEVQMLRRLHKAQRLEITIPHEPEHFQPHLEDYWRQKQTRHKRRMIVSGVAVVPLSLLSVLPGPNVIGLAAAYVAWHHWRIKQGVKKARTGGVEIEIKSSGQAIEMNSAAIEQEAAAPTPKTETP